MDTVRLAEIHHLQSESTGAFRVLHIALDPKAHVDITHSEHSLTIDIFKPTDDDLRKIQFACGEVK